MKKIILALVVLLSVQFANAQVKPAAAAKKAVESAEAASQDPKKAPKVATWLKLAKAYMDAYNSPKGNASNLVGMGVTNQEVMLTLAGEKPLREEDVVISGEPCKKQVFETRDYIYNRNGQFFMIVVTKPLFEDPLGEALKAYVKAYEVDVKQSKLKDIQEGIAKIAKEYFEDAINAYTLGDNATASDFFAKSAEASATAPYSNLNGEALFNAAYTAAAANDLERAEALFNKCLENKYYHTNGDVYLQLAGLREKAVIEASALVDEAQNKANKLDFQIYNIEGQIFNSADKIKKIKLNESDLKRTMGRSPKKAQLDQQAKFVAERTALEENVAKLQAQLGPLKAEYQELSAVVSKYEAVVAEKRTDMINYLEEGFKQFPDNSFILNALITTILTSKQNPDRLFELLETAKAKDPQNGDYYRIEGDIYRNLRLNIKGESQEESAKKQEYFDSAILKYDEALKLSPQNEDAFIGKGLLYHDYSVELSDKASKEMDDAKYQALETQAMSALKNAAVQFENAYDVVKDAKRKHALAQEIKRIYFRFRSNGGEDEAKYNKYDEIVRQAN